MDYIIRNKNSLYIKLNENGRPVTCSESQKGLFEYSKANNICNSLPRTMKKMNFQVEAIPDILPKINKGKILESNTYEPSENITRWINKIGQFEDVLNEINSRNEELNIV